ncbi:MAG: hypothetical protein LBU61_02645 [Coriobacteriales bacterium]|jgi:hypothetical protein|nr:hypothetical protein [Coriobacteriales bacterium]
MPKKIDQYSCDGCLILTLDTKLPVYNWWPVIINGVEYKLVPALDIGLNRFVIKDTGENLIGYEVEFTSLTRARDKD